MYVAVYPDADALDYPVGYAQDEFQLGYILNGHLLHVLTPHFHVGQGIVGQRHVFKGKHPLPRDQNVVEYGQGVHFIVLTRQRVIEQGSAQVVGLPANELQARGIDRNREADAILLVLLGVRPQGPVDRGEQLVGERSQGGQQLCAADNYPFIRGVDNAAGYIRVGKVAYGNGPVYLGVAECMGKAQVVFADVFIIGDEVIGETLDRSARIRGPSAALT